MINNVGMIHNIALLLEVFTFLYGFAAIYGRKMKYDIYDVVYLISDMMLLIGINENTMPTYLISISYVLKCIYCVLKYKASIKQAVINWGIVYVYISVLQLICYIPILCLLGVDSVIKEVLVFFMCLAIMYFGGTKIKMKAMSEFLLGNNVILLIISGFVFMGLGSKVWQVRKSGIIEAEDYIPLIYFVILLFIIVYEWQKTRNDAERKKAQLEMNALYYDAYEGLIQSIREKQHDFRNHINAVAGMIYTNDTYEELADQQKKYFDEILGEMEEVSLLTLVENPLLSGFLVRKIREAELKGIVVTWECVWKSQELKVPEYKLVEMMGILFDNAMEATEKLEKNRIMQVSLGKEGTLFVFSIVNTYDGELLSTEIFENGHSSKGKGGGLGLAKLRRMTEEADGGICMEHGWKENCRTVKLEIRVPI